MHPRHPTFWFALGLVVTWSSGFIGAELGTRATGSITLLAWRFGLAALAAAAWLTWRMRRGRHPSRRDLAVHTVIALLSQAGYVYGVVHAVELGISAATSALIAALQPVVATVAAGTVLGETTTWRTWAGLGLGLGGTALVVSADTTTATAPMWAYAVPVAAMLSLVAGTVTERRAYRDRRAPHLVDALAIQFLVSGTAFTGLAAATGQLTPPARTDFWIAVAWVIVLSSFAAYGCYWAVTARGGVTRVSALLYLTPGTTAIWAWLMLDQTMTGAAIVGMVVCVSAVALIVAPTRARAATTHPAADPGPRRSRRSPRRQPVP